MLKNFSDKNQKLLLRFHDKRFSDQTNYLFRFIIIIIILIIIFEVF